MCAYVYVSMHVWRYSNDKEYVYNTTVYIVHLSTNYIYMYIHV